MAQESETLVMQKLRDKHKGCEIESEIAVVQPLLPDLFAQVHLP